MRGSTITARAGRRVSRRFVLGAAATITFWVAIDGIATAAPSGERRVALFNPHTGEDFRDVYWCDGSYLDESLRRIDWLMRDFHRGEVARIDPALVDLLNRLGGTLGTGSPFHILSGYRSAATNRLLEREGLAPAAHSLHMHGQAADICIEKVRLRHLRRAALALRAGGVGTYAHFVHVDVGPVRVW